MSETQTQNCEALVENNWRTNPCCNSGKYDIAGHAVCGTHRRLALKWESEGRLNAMMKRWWGLT